MTTMVSVRLPDDEAAALEHEAAKSNSTVSELVRKSVRMMLARTVVAREAEIYAQSPLTSQELLDPEEIGRASCRERV